MTITIELPFPSPELHAHSKGSHWPKSKATKAAREQAFGFGLQARNKRELPKCDCRSEISYSFFVPDLIARDESNMVQSEKPALDGLVDAGVIFKDDWRHLHTAQIDVELDRERPRVVLRIEWTGIVPSPIGAKK